MDRTLLVLILVIFFKFCTAFSGIVINTWPFSNATDAGWRVLNKTGSALDAVEAGCSRCEVDQCDGTVGYGGSPDEVGETSLDAMIMDGVAHDVGAVADLRRIKQAISVARAVMQYTKHSMLAGESATRFAVEMGFQQTNLTTNTSAAKFSDWIKNQCQPNFRQNVTPDPAKFCGPYRPVKEGSTISHKQRLNHHVSDHNHDTIGMIAIDSQGRIAGGTSTNGATHKVPGRVGDSPIPGAGAYVEQGIGGAAATGDGDVMMRFLPSFHTVTLMGSGMPARKATQIALERIVKFYPSFSGAIVAVDMNGNHGAACHGFSAFSYSYRTSADNSTQFVNVICTKSNM